MRPYGAPEFITDSGLLHTPDLVGAAPCPTPPVTRFRQFLQTPDHFPEIRALRCGSGRLNRG
jgi:hypothetical protein